MNKIANSSGFTLIEIMIAMFVLAIGLLGAAGVATTIISGKHIRQGDYHRHDTGPGQDGRAEGHNLSEYRTRVRHTRIHLHEDMDRHIGFACHRHEDH